MCLDRPRRCADNRHRSIHNWTACLRWRSPTRTNCIHWWNTFRAGRLGWNRFGWCQWQKWWLCIRQALFPMRTEARHLLTIDAAHIGTIGRCTRLTDKHKHSIVLVTTAFGYGQSNTQRVQLCWKNTIKLVLDIFRHHQQQWLNLLTDVIRLNFRNQFGHWRSRHCVIGHGKQSRNLTVHWRNEICTGKLVWRSIGWTNWQKRWNSWWRSVCFEFASIGCWKLFIYLIRRFVSFPLSSSFL